MWVWNLVPFFRENKLQAFRGMHVFPILVSYVGVEPGSFISRKQRILQAFRRTDVFPILVQYVGVELGSFI